MPLPSASLNFITTSFYEPQKTSALRIQLQTNQLRGKTGTKKEDKRNSQHYSANIYSFKFNNRNTRKRCEICLKLTIKTPERRHCVFIVNFGHISHLFVVFLMFTLNK